MMLKSTRENYIDTQPNNCETAYFISYMLSLADLSGRYAVTSSLVSRIRWIRKTKKTQTDFNFRNGVQVKMFTLIAVDHVTQLK